MNRRGFLKFLGIGAAAAAGVALEQAIPFGRVWSFPSKIVIPCNHLETTWYTDESLKVLCNQLEIGDVFKLAGWPERFVVSRILENGTVELYRPQLLMRGVPRHLLRDPWSSRLDSPSTS